MATTYIISGSAVVEAVSAQRCTIISGFTSGCTITRGMAVYLDSNSEWQPCVQTAQSGSLTKFDGMVSRDYTDGDPVTVFGRGARFNYSSDMTPGQFLYVATSGSEGRLTDTPKIFAGPSASGSIVDLPVAKVLTANEIVIIR